MSIRLELHPREHLPGAHVNIRGLFSVYPSMDDRHLYPMETSFICTNDELLEIVRTIEEYMAEHAEEVKQ